MTVGTLCKTKFKKAKPRSSAMPQNSQFSYCYRCKKGRQDHDSCQFKNAVCHFCHVRGHIANACKKKRQDRQEVGQSSKNSETRSAHLLATEDNTEEEVYSMFTCSLDKSKAYETTVKINGQDVVMQIDTGASVSVIN